MFPFLFTPHFTLYVAANCIKMADIEKASIDKVDNVAVVVADVSPVAGGEAARISKEREEGVVTRFLTLFKGNENDKKNDDKDNAKNIPEMTFLELFKIFLWFGCRAFGGPVAQIALMKEELVTQQEWITETRFMRAFAIYQVLPGPEAMELACYFGYLAKGRFGAFLGGLGFLLPGVLLMLLCSWVYVTYGLKDAQTQASFRCIQVCVAALIFRGTYKLADGVVKDKKTKAFSFINFYMVLWCFLTSVINLNFFISIATCGVMNTVLINSTHKRKELIAIFCSCVTIGFYILYIRMQGMPTGSMIGGTQVGDQTLGGLFVLGLIAGLVTFGGAYTTLPFIFTAAVQNGGWLSQQAFLDAIAITNTLPTPLVSFLVLPGFVGSGIGGAIVITIGVFLPAFSFTIIGHEFFEKIVEDKMVEPFLDGVGTGVIGLLLMTCFQFLRAAVIAPVDACIFYLALQASFQFTDKYTQPLILLTAAIAGQALYA